MAQPKAASAAAQLSLAASACIAGTIDVYCSIENASFIGGGAGDGGGGGGGGDGGDRAPGEGDERAGVGGPAAEGGEGKLAPLLPRRRPRRRRLLRRVRRPGDQGWVPGHLPRRLHLHRTRRRNMRETSDRSSLGRVPLLWSPKGSKQGWEAIVQEAERRQGAEMGRAVGRRALHAAGGVGRRRPPRRVQRRAQVRRRRRVPGDGAHRHPSGHSQGMLRAFFAERPIFFSSFQPDAARIMRKLQDRYPVYFLTKGGTQVFADERRNSLEAAVKLCVAGSLRGIVSEARAVLRQPSAIGRIKEAGLSLLTYGQLNNVPKAVYLQQLMGVDGVIVDLVAEIAAAVSEFAAAAAAAVPVPERDSSSSYMDGGGDVGLLEMTSPAARTTASFSRREDVSFLLRLTPELVQ
ncbi:Os04g0394100 [Oryza sativa Japonica Group]|uniref:glycerophosphodiester phosphodiesterase n=1 Tax=Oryza sativa subsp. japonica TaxID=39947 RepID=A0A0P0W9Q9_ORYSJ|nr:Os04g0394100 [Oryza sativa Japonica Group]